MLRVSFCLCDIPFSTGNWTSAVKPPFLQNRKTIHIPELGLVSDIRVRLFSRQEHPKESHPQSHDSKERSLDHDR